MTGGCGLSRKLLTMALLSFATISGAQTATGPNKVYIEQVVVAILLLSNRLVGPTMLAVLQQLWQQQ